ncbi:pggt1b [Trichonephila clavipes]|nr:pggt1b [Trichonephila clavipes]GFW78961.1 pggt1b [Trichonephila clavipes]
MTPELAYSFHTTPTAIYRALQLIDSNMPRKYCTYTDSINGLEALENYNHRCHPVFCNVLDITSRLYSKSFDIVFCWLPSNVARQSGKVGGDPSAASSSAIGYEARHPTSYFYDLTGIMESAVG